MTFFLAPSLSMPAKTIGARGEKKTGRDITKDDSAGGVILAAARAAVGFRQA